MRVRQRRRHPEALIVRTIHLSISVFRKAMMAGAGLTLAFGVQAAPTVHIYN
ncbi:polyamine ABC transporter substrate-binding protein, partial [Pseudomonas otitidis]